MPGAVCEMANLYQSLHELVHTMERAPRAIANRYQKQVVHEAEQGRLAMNSSYGMLVASRVGVGRIEASPGSLKYRRASEQE